MWECATNGCANVRTGQRATKSFGGGGAHGEHCIVPHPLPVQTLPPCVGVCAWWEGWGGGHTNDAQAPSWAGCKARTVIWSRQSVWALAKSRKHIVP